MVYAYSKKQGAKSEELRAESESEPTRPVSFSTVFSVLYALCSLL
jgi:hypothetical protein